MEKLKKTAKVLDRFAKIFKVIFIAAAIFLFAGLIITSVYYLAIRDDDAVAVLVGGDADTGRVLYGKDADTARPMASTTKIMTCT